MMNDEELIERIINLNYREFGAEVGNDLKRIIIKKEQEINQLQSNWNSLREWLEKEIDFQSKIGRTIINGMTFIGQNESVYKGVLNKMNELEGRDKDEF